MRLTPRWVSVALLIGAVVCVAWAIFLFGFTSEPSADRRSKTVLLVWSGLSNGAAFTGAVAAVGLLRSHRSARTLAWLASIFISATCVGAIAGIPALIGLWSSRSAVRP